MSKVPYDPCEGREFMWCEQAAKDGNLNLLKWARANGALWNVRVCATAAIYGQLECIKWARANGAPFDKWTCTFAAMEGHINVLQWVRANGAPWDEDTFKYAYNNHRYDTLNWLIRNGMPFSDATFSDETLNRFFPNILSACPGIAVSLLRMNRGTTQTNIAAKQFIITMYSTLPLIFPLCDLIINY